MPSANRSAMQLEFREITADDVPALFAVRVATRENTLDREELEALGITADSVRAMLESTHRGWLCRYGDGVAGFAMGNGATGEMWVIAVLPACEGQGIGARLITLVEEWLWALGWKEIWLTTDRDVTLRAYGFYRRHGWQDTEIRNGVRYMRKVRPGGALSAAPESAAGG